MIETVLSYQPDDINQALSKWEGMVGLGTRTLINRCSSLVDKENCYLELGTFMGSSLCSAGYGNKTVCYGVDDFLPGYEPEDKSFLIEDVLKQNIKNMTNVSYFKMRCRSFLEAPTSLIKEKAQLYFYDAGHSYDDTYVGITLALPFLSNDALIFVDDTDNEINEEPKSAIYKVVKDVEELSLVRVFEKSQYIQNGLMVLSFKRK